MRAGIMTAMIVEEDVSMAREEEVATDATAIDAAMIAAETIGGVRLEAKNY
jgi:hypothetical protein